MFVMCYIANMIDLVYNIYYAILHVYQSYIQPNDLFLAYHPSFAQSIINKRYIGGFV
jgi:hypothetical protein